MPAGEFLLVCGAILVIAFLYSSVGHAGASGYIAVLTLFGFAPEAIRPIALVLNVLVATIGFVQFSRAGHFSWALFWPFAVLAVPLAFAGGYLTLPTQWLKLLLGMVLLASAVQFLRRPVPDGDVRAPAPGIAVPVGGALGLLAGLTGTGGGIFLTPMLILLRWAATKQAAAVSALFILANSLAGLAGNMTATRDFPAVALSFAAVAAAGGVMGSHLGARRLDVTAIKRLLALVLTIAGIKLVFA